MCSVAPHWQSCMSVLRPGRLRVCRPLTMRTSKPAASSTPYSASPYTPVACIATECTPWDFNQSRSACNCEVTVPNTAGSSPATDTCMCSLPTSTNAARASNIARDFIAHLRCKPHRAREERRPGRVTEETNLSNGKLCSPKCATDHDQSQSSMQAIELIVRRTKGSVSHAVGAPHVNLQHTPWFMVRVWCRSALQASIERTCPGVQCTAAHVKR